MKSFFTSLQLSRSWDLHQAGFLFACSLYCSPLFSRQKHIMPVGNLVISKHVCFQWRTVNPFGNLIRGVRLTPLVISKYVCFQRRTVNPVRSHLSCVPCDAKTSQAFFQDFRDRGNPKSFRMSEINFPFCIPCDTEPPIPLRLGLCYSRNSES